MQHLILSLLILSFSLQVLASHPTEGLYSLEVLTEEALNNNAEIKAAEAALQLHISQHRSALGAFAPELSLEGGSQQTKFDDTKDSGQSVYGKAEWNLYQGGKDLAQNNKTEIERQLAEFKLQNTKAKIARDVAKTYYEMAFILEALAIKERALELNKEQTRLAVTKRAAGFTSESDVIEFELREATIQSDIKELLQEKESLSRALSVLLGRNQAASDLSVKGHLQPEPTKINKERVLKMLTEVSPELTQAKAELELSRQEKNLARSGFLPKIDLEAKYGKLATDEEVYDDKNNYAVGLNIKIPLFSGLSDFNQVRASSALVAKNEAQLQNQILSSHAEAENLMARLTSLTERLELEAKTLLSSEQYYKITLGEYRRGIKNSPDMVGAAERLLNSKIRNLEFRRNYQLTLLQLQDKLGLDPKDKTIFLANTSLIEKTIPPGKGHEECFELQPTSLLAYSFNSTLPMDFNLHYHTDKEVFYPTKQSNSSSYKAQFKPKIKQDYCLMWTNKGKEPVTLRYDFKIE